MRVDGAGGCVLLPDVCLPVPTMFLLQVGYLLLLSLLSLLSAGGRGHLLKVLDQYRYIHDQDI